HTTEASLSAADAGAAAAYDGMRIRERIDRLMTPRTALELHAHRLALGSPDDVREEIAEPELERRFGQEDVGQPVHDAARVQASGRRRSVRRCVTSTGRIRLDVHSRQWQNGRSAARGERI